MSKDVAYVDAEDNVIGSGSISNAVENGIRVRIARIFLTNSNGELLIQKRSSTVRSLPNRWDQSAAGHVDAGETYDETAARELQEEMGIKDVELIQISKYYTEETDEKITKKRFNVVFTGAYDGDVTIDQDEVSDYIWVRPEELGKHMKSNPQDYTEGFIECFNVFAGKQ